MDWSELIPSLLKSPITIYKNRKLIQKWWIKLLAYANFGTTDIVILGRPAVGKSVLCSALHGEASDLTFKMPQISTSIETKAIQLGDWTHLVRVIPGQTIRERARGLENEFYKNEKLDGLIYVVDWGYTDERDDVIKKSLIQRENIQTIRDLRDFNLKKELEDFKILLESVKNAISLGKGPKWLIIAVNKVDLFLDQIDEAQKYYNLSYVSEFTKLANDALAEIGKQNLKIITLPISAWQTDLIWNQEIVKTNIGSREADRALIINFISNIAELSK